MKDYENYTKDLLKLNPTLRFTFGMRDKQTLSHYENNLSDEYFENLTLILDKYNNTKDIELQLELYSTNFYMKNFLYLLLFASHENFILLFNYENKVVYPKNIEYELSRIKDFHNYIKTIIIRAKQGIKLKITYPKIIIKKFLNQIKCLEDYKYLYQFIKKDYYPFCRNEIGLCYIPNGKEIYKEIIKEFIGYLNLTPEEIHNLGLSLIKTKIHKTTDLYKSKKELFDDCLYYANHIYKVTIQQFFHYKMKQPFIISPVADDLINSVPLAYYDVTENKIFINLSYYNEISKQEIYQLLLHECFHYYHYEFMKFYKLPKYKIYLYSNIALIEGFAHYMETFCENYDDNNNFDLLRKLRLVLDTGINYYGWTYKQSYKFINDYFPIKSTDNINEIDRCICTPGQSLSYLIGKLHIIELKELYLKSGGNIKDFHQKLLIEGPASFETIDKKFI